MSEKKSNPKRETRFRNFVSIGYPESLKTNWIQQIKDLHIQALISPLHDKDKTPEGEDKKPHFHIMLMFDSVKTMDQAQKIFDDIGAIKCQAIKSLRGEARYLLHLDNPEKVQYDVKDVQCIGGADFQEIISLPSDRYAIIRDILQFIERYDIRSFSELLLWTSTHKEDWFRALCDNSAYVIKEHIASRLYTFEHNLGSDTSAWKTVPPGKENNDAE